ncbi:hypothetical protein ACQJBY_022764 [Aegilops geniculata]
MEFAGASLLHWSFIGLQWSSPEAISAELELPAGLQWRGVEAVALAAACCNPTPPSTLIRRLNRRMISLRNHPADL